MHDYLEQLFRTRRYLERMENVHRGNTVEYRDDLWSFFQNAWHLKDWIANDTSIPRPLRDQIVSQAHDESEENLRICQDLCNRSKHLSLTRNIQREANVNPGHNVNVFPPAAGGTDHRESEYTHNVLLPNGTRYIAQELAMRIVDDWVRIIGEAGLPTSQD